MEKQPPSLVLTTTRTFEILFYSFKICNIYRHLYNRFETKRNSFVAYSLGVLLCSVVLQYEIIYGEILMDELIIDPNSPKVCCNIGLKRYKPTHQTLTHRQT